MANSSSCGCQVEHLQARELSAILPARLRCFWVQSPHKQSCVSISLIIASRGTIARLVCKLCCNLQALSLNTTHACSVLTATDVHNAFANNALLLNARVDACIFGTQQGCFDTRGGSQSPNLPCAVNSHTAQDTNMCGLDALARTLSTRGQHAACVRGKPSRLLTSYQCPLSVVSSSATTYVCCIDRSTELALQGRNPAEQEREEQTGVSGVNHGHAAPTIPISPRPPLKVVPVNPSKRGREQHGNPAAAAGAGSAGKQPRPTHGGSARAACVGR